MDSVASLGNEKLRRLAEEAIRLSEAGMGVADTPILEAFLAAANLLDRKDRLEQRFEEILTKADSCIAKLYDPEYGPIGQELLVSAREAGIKDRVDPRVFRSAYKDDDQPYFPVFCSFGMDREEYGLANVINFDPNKAHPAAIIRAKTHETAHALSLRHSAALNASPWNPYTNIILCPRDFVRVMQLSEQDAYAKEAWLCSLAIPYCDEMDTVTDLAPIRARDFLKTRTRGQSLHDVLQESAQECLDVGRSLSHGKAETYRRYYTSLSLKTYADALKVRKELGFPDPICVCLENAHLVSIGDSYGPNVFADKDRKLRPEYAAMPVFEGDDEELWKQLKADLRIGFDESRLFTLNQGLDQVNMTLAEFLNLSCNQASTHLDDGELRRPKIDRSNVTPIALTR